jgi:hypothetical protein
MVEEECGIKMYTAKINKPESNTSGPNVNIKHEA